MGGKREIGSYKIKSVTHSAGDMRKLFEFIVILFMLVSCMPAVNNTSEISTPSAPTATQPACQPSKILTSQNQFSEIQGTMKTGGTLWALLFFDKAYAKQDLKIVWKVTFSGTGPGFQVQAENETGIKVMPVWGPEFHESSNWNRPGTEYGTGFNFPEAGCWTITVTSGETIGKIFLDVIAP